jgi:hypothetical protein
VSVGGGVGVSSLGVTAEAGVGLGSGSSCGEGKLGWPPAPSAAQAASKKHNPSSRKLRFMARL